MLPKEYRLKKHSAFAATYKTGRTLRKDGIILFIGKEKSTDQPEKVGFVISKKVHKRAVKRNRIKRLMRESYRLQIKDGINNKKYLSLIFVGSAKLIGKNFKEIDTIMRALTEKL